MQILSTEEQIRQLSSQLWDTSDKLVVTKKDYEELKITVCQLKRMLANQVSKKTVNFRHNVQLRQKSRDFQKYVLY